MIVLNRDGLERFAFCSLACTHVSEHEAVILELVTSLRDRGPSATRDTLELLVAEERVSDMLDMLSRLGAVMAVAGIFPGQPVAVKDTRD